MKRKYNKKSEYWKHRKPSTASETIQRAPFSDALPEGIGESFTSASFSDSGTSSTVRGGRSTSSADRALTAYENLKEFVLPWNTSGEVVNMSEIITLCQKAHANVATFRNTIEVMTEFCNTKIILKGGNARARDLIYSWLDKIGAHQVLEEGFRELTCAGNWFAYRVDGKLKNENFEDMQEITAAKKNLLPLKYITLNPATIGVENGVSYKGAYVKMLSTYEIERLKHPRTPEEKDLFDSLPPEAKKQIKDSRGAAQQIYIPIDPTKLHYTFLKKQSYQALAVPMGFPVLKDIEFKLTLKKMDMALARTIEHVILLVTTGEAVTEHGGGVNPKAITRLQELFRNETVGRVLVADYTTKAQWVIPDIGKVIGEEKYRVVNKDIQDGLQMILMGEEKFANSQTKVKIFIERLKSIQDLMLKRFLQPEINKVCENMNFKNVPVAHFEKIDLEDTTNVGRLYIRMAELGLITPEELTNVLETGILPDKETNIENQKEYKTLRDKGYYFPLVGGSKEEEGGEGGRPGGSTGPKASGKIGTAKASENTEEKFSTKSIILELSAATELESVICDKLKKKFKIKRLNDAQTAIAHSLTKSIIVNEEKTEWTNKIEEYIKSPKEIPLETGAKIDEISLKYNVDSFVASVLYKSKI